MKSTRFSIGLTADFYNENGNTLYEDIGLDVFEGFDNVVVSKIAEDTTEITSDQLFGHNIAFVLSPSVTADSIKGNREQLLAISRFGVGYDNVDVESCTANDVLVLIAQGAVNRSVAEATITWMLALTHHVIKKNDLVRTGRWNDRNLLMGSELRDKTLGIVGFGGIGKALVELLNGFGMKRALVYDPQITSDIYSKFDVTKVEKIEDLLMESDFVSLHCPLNQETLGMIGERQLKLMKSSAYLLNLSRGGIVNEDALYDALINEKISGAAIDCFQEEPILSPHRFGTLDNVILAPHSIAWTNELFRDIGKTACQSMLNLSLGKRPEGVVNPEVFESLSFNQKWSRYTT